MREKNEFEPEFRRVALRRTPSHEQLADEESIKTSMRKTGVISSNLKKTGSFTSLTAINRSISRSGSPAPGEYNEPEFKGVSLKKVDNSPSRPAWSRSGSRAGSPDKKETEFKRVGLKQTAGSSKTGSRRGSATEETEMASINLKKTQRVQSDQSKFELEHVDLKGFKNGEVGEDSVQNQINQTIKQSKASNLEKKKFEKMEKKKFESGDDEFESISDSLTKLKKGGSRAGSPDQEDPEFMKVSLKQTPNSSNHHSGASSRRGSTAEETEISQMNLKRTSRVKSDHSKLELEHVNLTGFSKAKAGNETVEIPREDNELETHSDSLQKLKKKTEHVEEESEIAKDASPVNEDPESESKKNEKPPVLPPVFTAPFEDHPVFYRRKPRRSETDEQKRKSVILDGEASGPSRPSNLRRQSFTSSLENIHVADQQQHEKVHLSVFTKEMGSNVDLVQVCKKTEEKQEAKLEFSDLTSISLFPSTNATQSTEQIENGLQKARSSTKINAKVDSLRSSAKTSRDESPVKELLDAKAALRKAKLSKSKQSNLELEEVHLKPVLRENESEENLESTEEILNAAKCILQSYKTKEGAEQTQVESDSGVEEESATSESESEAKSGKLHKLRKAPSIDGLFQTQDTHAAFTFKLPS